MPSFHVFPHISKEQRSRKKSAYSRRKIAIGLVAIWGVLNAATVHLQDDTFFPLLFSTGVSLALIMLGTRLVPDLRNGIAAWIVLGYLYDAIAIRPYLMLATAYYEILGHPLTVAADAILVRASWLGTLSVLAAVGAIALWRKKLAKVTVQMVEEWNLPEWVRNSYFKFGVLLSYALVVLIPGLTLGLWKLGIGIHGGPSSSLPFRLGGILVALRGLLPMLCLLVILCGYRSGHNWLRKLGVGLILAWIVLAVLTVGSRAILIQYVIVLGVLISFMSKQPFVDRRMVILLIAAVVGTGLFWPLSYEYRQLITTDIGFIAAFKLSRELSQGSNSGSIVSAFFLEPAMRIGGIDLLLPLLRTDYSVLGFYESLDLFSSGSDFARYYTNWILGYPLWARTAFAPSVMGWFYILGGPFLVPFGVFVITNVILAVWVTILKANFLTRPVMLAALSFAFVSWLSDATYEVIIRKDIYIMIASLGGIEIMTRAFCGGHRSRTSEPASGHALHQPEGGKTLSLAWSSPRELSDQYTQIIDETE